MQNRLHGGKGVRCQERETKKLTPKTLRFGASNLIFCNAPLLHHSITPIDSRKGERALKPPQGPARTQALRAPDSSLTSLSQTSIQRLAGYAQMHGSDGLVGVGAFHGFRNQQLFSLFKGG